MKKPSKQTMVMGHPVVAVPLTLTSGVTLIAGFQTGSLFPVFIAIAILAGVQTARAQARAYRAWKAEWDGMEDRAVQSGVTPGRFLGVAVIAMVMLVAFGMPHELAYMAGYALGWMGTQLWLLALLGLLFLAVLVQFVRHYPRRPKATKPVTVIAKAILPVPSLAAAYAALPDYCQRLLARSGS